MLAMPTSAPLYGKRLPNRMITAKATAGMTAISQACSRNQPAGSSALVEKSGIPRVVSY